VEECPVVATNCALVAVITDTRGNEFTYDTAQGPKKVYRPPIPVGTRIVVPHTKIRRRAVPNPTDHNIIFVSQVGTVYCWEPVALL
jgi:hypothetical protein